MLHVKFSRTVTRREDKNPFLKNPKLNEILNDLHGTFILLLLQCLLFFFKALCDYTFNLKSVIAQKSHYGIGFIKPNSIL